MQANPFSQAFPAAPLAQPGMNPGTPAQGNPFGQPASPQGAAPAQTPAQTFGQPAGASQAPAQAPALGGGFGLGLPSIGDVSEAGRRLPAIPSGTHLLEFSSNVIKTRKGHTVVATLKIIQSDNAGFPAGSEVTFVQKIPAEQDKRGAALGAILGFVRGFAGFADEATFKAQCPQANQLFQAAVAGQPLPFAGRRAWCQGSQGDAVIDSRTGAPVPGKFWIRTAWAPASA